MDIDEGESLVQKAMKVILSCKTTEQLINANTYAGLVYRVLQCELGLVNNTNFIVTIERSIGFAQCQIKANEAKP